MRGGGPRRAGESRDSGGRRDIDVNRERLIYFCLSLVGHRVTAKLRNNIFYEGLFHSCSLDSDFSITLRSARQLPSENSASGEVIPTLVIPGRDFLQVSAVDVPPPTMHEDAGRNKDSQRFATDAEISQKRWAAGENRELVPWQSGDDAPPPPEQSSLEENNRDKPWDQFEANRQLYGVESTYTDELYTTKLDPNSIPHEKRLEADRIAREIERGPQHSEMEGRMEDEDVDEEAKFSSVGRRSTDGGPRGSRHGADAQESPPPDGQVALTKERLSQHDTYNGLEGDSFALEHRAKRGMITAHSSMRPLVRRLEEEAREVTEMKRINALNLEPALPKLDDKTRSDWISFKQSQTRNPSKATQGLKQEFQQSLQVIQQREAQKQKQATTSFKPAPPDNPGGAAASAAAAQTPEGQGSEAADAHDASKGSKSFAFNRNAKEFSFNLNAPAFTPSSNNNQAPFSPTNQNEFGMKPATATASAPPAQPAAGAPAPAQAQAQRGPSPAFNMREAPAERDRRSLAQIFDSLFDHIRGERTEVVLPDWPQAKGSTFREALGRPNNAGPPAMMQHGNGGAPGGGPGAWQQQPTSAPHGHPQTMLQPGQAVMMPAGAIAAQGGQMAMPKFPGGAQMVPVVLPGGQFMQGGYAVQPQGQPVQMPHSGTQAPCHGQVIMQQPNGPPMVMVQQPVFRQMGGS